MVRDESYLAVSRRAALRQEDFGGILHDGTHWFELNHSAFHVMRLLNGKRTVRETARESGVNLHDLKRFLGYLESCSILRMSQSPLQRIESRILGPVFEYHTHSQEKKRPPLRSPLKVGIEITGFCDRQCTFCSTSHYKVAHLPPGVIKGLLAECRNLGVFVMTLSGGEPFMHPEILDILRLFTEKDRPLLCPLTSNGSEVVRRHIASLVDLGVARIQISLPAAEPDRYLELTGHSMEQVNKTILCLLQAGIDVILCCTVFPGHLDQIAKTAEFARDRGIRRVHLMTLMSIGRAKMAHRIFSPEDYLKLVRKILEVQRLYAEDLSIDFNREYLFTLRERSICGHSQTSFLRGCKAGKSEIYVLPDGSVYPCQVLSGFAHWNCGSIYERSLDDLWRNTEQLDKLRVREDAALMECRSRECPYQPACRGGCPAEEEIACSRRPFRCVMSNLALRGQFDELADELVTSGMFASWI